MVNCSALIGRFVKIRANEFIETEIFGYIQFIDIKTNNIAIALTDILEVGNVRYGWVIAGARLERDNLDTFANSDTLGCGITFVPDSKFKSANPFDLSWWRGGAAAITDIVLV